MGAIHLLSEATDRARACFTHGPDTARQQPFQKPFADKQTRFRRMQHLNGFRGRMRMRMRRRGWVGGVGAAILAAAGVK